ncbi:hypothetical protein F4677DRAFT_461438 [Hypoxylon crocopeplum]|nr:hypothetical protein F4677DRAFT_461438 [Hypoxylon crocopeplum]
MCNHWEMKKMACGHLIKDPELVQCAQFNLQRPNDCAIHFHVGDDVRLYRLGDGECMTCAHCRRIQNVWLRATWQSRDIKRLELLAQREYLIGLPMVTLEHVEAIQKLLIAMWDVYGEVVSVDKVLRALGYYVPPEGFEPNKPVMPALAEGDPMLPALGIRGGNPMISGRDTEMVDALEIAAPDIAMPNVAGPYDAVANVAMLDPATLNVTVPDIPMLDIENPYVTVPDVDNTYLAMPILDDQYIATPDLNNVDVAMPDLNNPYIAMPDVSNLDVTMLDANNLDIAMPDAYVPDVAFSSIGALNDVADPFEPAQGRATSAFDMFNNNMI